MARVMNQLTAAALIRHGLILTVLLLSGTAASLGAAIMVTNTNDSGPGSLPAGPGGLGERRHDQLQPYTLPVHDSDPLDWFSDPKKSHHSGARSRPADHRRRQSILPMSPLSPESYVRCDPQNWFAQGGIRCPNSLILFHNLPAGRRECWWF